MTKTHESLERLRERKEQLEEKLKRLRHEQRYQNRKADARRKIIVGGPSRRQLLVAISNLNSSSAS